MQRLLPLPLFALGAGALLWSARIDAGAKSPANPYVPKTAVSKPVPALADHPDNLHAPLRARLDFEALNLELAGITSFQGKASCCIRHPAGHDQIVYTVGDVIGGFKIAAIDADDVMFERDGAQFWLVLQAGKHTDKQVASNEVLWGAAEKLAPEEAAAQEKLIAAIAAQGRQDNFGEIDEEVAPEGPAPVVDGEAAIAPVARPAFPEETQIASLTTDAAVEPIVLEPVLDDTEPLDGEVDLLPGERVTKTAPQAYKIRTENYGTVALATDSNETDPERMRPYSYRSMASASPPRSSRSPGSQRFILPVRGELSSGYGYRRHPTGGQRRFHRGVDIAAPSGRQVVAAAAGVVSKVSTSYSYGRFVEITHSSGFTTVYAHLSRQLARAGQSVDRGDAVGQIGSTGMSTGPHLHFEVHRNGQALNPESYINVPQ